jgi:hypothetical protein
VDACGAADAKAPAANKTMTCARFMKRFPCGLRDTNRHQFAEGDFAPTDGIRQPVLRLSVVIGV